MNKIDIHLHIALEDHNINKDMKISNSKDMKNHLINQKIDKGIILSSGETDGKFNNDEIKTICSQNPGFFYWMANFTKDNIDTVYERMKRYKEDGAVGIGELTINEPIDHPFIQEIFASAEKLNLPILFHMSPAHGFNYGIVDSAGMPLLEEALKKYSDLIIIGHSQPFWQEISGDMDPSNESRNAWGSGPVVEGGRLPYLMDKYPNLYCDLSANSGGMAIMRDEKFGLEFLEKYQDRIMFGTDMVNVDMVFPLGKWLDEKFENKELSASAYTKICRTNASTLFGLED